MDSISTAELLELVLIGEQFIDAQLEFWITATFATIVASFVGQEYFTLRIKLIVSAMYVLATAVFVSRWMYEAQDLIVYFQEILSRGVILEAPKWTVRLRMLLVLFGSFATLYFVNLYRHDEGT